MKRPDLQHITRCRQERRPALQIGETIRTLRAGPLLRDAGVRAALESALVEAVGPALAGRVRIGGIKQGKLLLFLDEPALRFEFQNYRYESILEAIRRNLPAAGVDELRFRLAGRGVADRGAQ